MLQICPGSTHQSQVPFFGLFAVLPWKMSAALLICGGMALTAVVCVLSARRLMEDKQEALLWGLAIAGLAIWLEPFRETIRFGQVNLLLMGLVGMDCLLPRVYWPRGTLIGFAAAFKLVPGIFILFFLVRRQWFFPGYGFNFILSLSPCWALF